jgi:16S rRNA (cytidine1402-2'-O)-methyltransferase
MGTLYLVATPIGNLEDISARALNVLRQVNLIAAEDTRQTRKLLEHYGITTPSTSYYEHNKLTKLEVVLEALSRGSVALVSDAGTPGLNDPGYELVKAALDAGHTVSAIPGPSAPIAALVASGLPTDAFLYLGYLPRRATARRRRLEEVADLPYTLIFLEAPHRLSDALADLESILGDRPIAVARELTKLHEEIFRGTIGSARAHFAQTPPRGEFTLVVAGRPSQAERWSAERVHAAIERELAEGASPAALAGRLAEASGWSRRELYRLILEHRRTNREIEQHSRTF